jgi:hypothetical protein
MLLEQAACALRTLEKCTTLLLRASQDLKKAGGDPIASLPKLIIFEVNLTVGSAKWTTLTKTVICWR